MFAVQSALESQVRDEKDKAQRLQTELDVSEQVQKDFVKLSQTLQVKRRKTHAAIRHCEDLLCNTQHVLLTKVGQLCICV